MTLRVHASGFKRTGLILFNPQIVLDTIEEFKAKQRVEEPPPNSPRSRSPNTFATPPPQSPRPTNWNDWPTPLTMRTRKKGVDYVRSRTVEAM